MTMMLMTATTATARAKRKLPFVSVVIPTRNNVDVLDECLKSLRNQDYPKQRYEIIIADDHSTDRTVNIAKKYKVKIVESDGPPGKQRNAGIAAAKGEIIGLTDSDCKVKMDWILFAVNHFTSDSAGNVAVVGGPNLTPKVDPFLSQCIGVVSASKITTAAMSTRYVRDGFIAKEVDETNLVSCNMFLRKSAFNAAGKFDTKLFPNEENELMFRIKAAGYKLLYVPSLVVWHHRRNSIRKFVKQNFNYGRSRAQFLKKHNAAFKPVFIMPTLFLLGLILGPVISMLNPNMMWLYLGVIILYLVVIISWGVYKSYKSKNWSMVLLLPMLSFMMHMSYGVGFLIGMMKK
jgi:glycosyltransferase involved in cell wall biosynthesis